MLLDSTTTPVTVRRSGMSARVCRGHGVLTPSDMIGRWGVPGLAGAGGVAESAMARGRLALRHDPAAHAAPRE
jgi:hypothetical protein